MSALIGQQLMMGILQMSRYGKYQVRDGELWYFLDAFGLKRKEHNHL